MSKPNEKRTIIGEPLERSITLERAESFVDIEKRTVDLCFSTDTPIQHWYGYIILDHKKKSVRTQRILSAGPVLENHDRNRHRGVVESVDINEKEGRGRASVKISRSAEGTDLLNDIEDGIKRNISVGFLIHDIEADLDKDGNQRTIGNDLVYRATDWEPFEISFASLPKDIAAGVGRSLDEEEKTENTQDFKSAEREVSAQEEEKTEIRKMSKPEEKNETTPPQTATVTAEQRELDRVDEFMKWGERFEEVELARSLSLDPDKTVADLRKAIMEKREKAQVEVEPRSAEEAAGKQNGVALPRHRTLQNFTGEKAEERAYRFGNWILGGVFGNERAAKYCADNGLLLRAQNETVNEKGGFLVPEEFGNDLIDLREQFGVFRRNCKIIPMTSDTRTDPKRTGGLTAFFKGESETLEESEKLWGQVSLTAKKLTVLARYSSEVSEDSVIGLADDLMGEIAYAFANKEDLCGFNGDGTSPYGGMVGVREKLKGLSGTIANIAGLHVGSGNAFSELTLGDFEAVVGLLPQYADTPMAKWFVHRSFYYNVMVKVMLASGGVTAAEIEASRTKQFLGYTVEFAQVLPKTEANSQVCAILGDLTKAARLGSRRDTTIALSEHSRFAEDEIELRGTERFDINVHDVGNASATAADREAGPVVGLITAAS